ncbi:unnamed protein product, partial [Ixodes pacificus]
MCKYFKLARGKTKGCNRLHCSPSKFKIVSSICRMVERSGSVDINTFPCSPNNFPPGQRCWQVPCCNGTVHRLFCTKDGKSVYIPYACTVTNARFSVFTLLLAVEHVFCKLGRMLLCAVVPMGSPWVQLKVCGFQ